MTGSFSGGMMKVMRPEQARDFYEEDEDPAHIEGVFETGEKGYTAPARGLRVRQQRGQTLGVLLAGSRRISGTFGYGGERVPLSVYWQPFGGGIPAKDAGAAGRRHATR